MRFITNESEYVNQCLTTGYVNKKNVTETAKILIKYYKSQGLTNKEVRAIVEDYLIKNYKDFNVIGWMDYITKLINKYTQSNQRIIDIPEIVITQKEIEKIKLLNNLDYELIYFSFLVYSKITGIINNNQLNWVNMPDNVIFEDAKLGKTIKRESRQLIIGYLFKNKYLSPSNKNNNLGVKVTHVYNDYVPAIVIKNIHNFKNFAYEYLKYLGDEKIINCESCGCLVKKNGNKTKYCDECARDKKLENDRLLQRNRYISRK